MPAPHDLDPPAMTEAERLEKKRQDAAIGFELAPPRTYPRVEVTGTEIVTTYVTDDGNICRAHDELTVGPGLSGFMLAGRLAERFKDNEPKARMTSAYVDARTIHHTMP